MQALKKAEFSPLEYDYSLFINTSRRTFIIIYVDDLLLIRPDIKFINLIKNHLASKFKMTNIGFVLIYLNINISRNLYIKTLIISQNKYVQKILKDYRFKEYKTADILLDVGIILFSIDFLYEPTFTEY